jgi:hypothetical protein
MKRFIPLLFLACGGSSDAPDAAADAAAESYGHKHFDASVTPDVVEEPEAAAKIPWNRMTSHGGVVVASPKIRALYVGANKNEDALMSWMVSSQPYWSILAQYGVGPGEFLGSETVDEANFFQPDDIQGGFIDASTLGWRIHQAIVALPPSDAGVANAWVVFLPGGINVDLGGGKTCTWALGYHWTNGAEPYSVIPGCGNSGTTITHEIAEMVTDPSGAGWYSDADIQPAGGEIGDLCNFPISFDSKIVTALWSNADGDCEPYSQ